MVYLAKKAIAKFSEIGMSYIVTYDTMSVTNIDDIAFGIDVHHHEEADTLLILHGIEVSHMVPFFECIIYSPDTDVFPLLVQYYPSLLSPTKLKTDIRMIDIGNCYGAIGPLRASSIIDFHTFTGCDQTGKFREESKSTWCKSDMESSSKTLNALSLLGSCESLPILESLEELESFVVQTYIGDKYPKHINTIPELRWYQFSKFQTETDKLPTTVSALKYKIFCSHYMTLVLKRPHLSLQILPPPEDFGWEKIDGELVLIMPTVYLHPRHWSN